MDYSHVLNFHDDVDYDCYYRCYYCFIVVIDDVAIVVPCRFDCSFLLSIVAYNKVLDKVMEDVAVYDSVMTADDDVVVVVVVVKEYTIRLLQH